MLPPQPVLSPDMNSPAVSPLSLPGSPPSPTLSHLSLDDRASLWAHDNNDDDASSTADTAESCTSASCCPPPPSTDDDIKPLPSSFVDTADPPPTAAPSYPIGIPESSFSPLVIIGAGPHALALAARLSEPHPAALYSDLEHARLAWLQREERGRERRNQAVRRQSVKGHWAARKLVEPATATLAGARPGPERAPSSPGSTSSARPAIQVLDSSSSAWRGRWDSFFSGLSIEHLRSPMLFHPAPADVNALVAYAQREGRENELLPIKGVVGAELSKHQRKKRPQRVGRAPMINEREREDYHRPSSALFRSFIDSDLVDRYSLAPPSPSPPLVAHTTVTSVSYEVVHVPGREPERGFVVRSTRPDGVDEVRGARAVVLAIGPSCTPSVPRVISEAAGVSRPGQEQERDGAGAASEGPGAGPWSKEAVCGEGWCHSTAFAMPGCGPMDGLLGERVRQGKPARVVVLGGGLTSAQIVDSLIKAGVQHVTLLSRSHIKVSAFDFPLSWVSKYANLDKMAFFGESCPHARHAMIRQARNGGSVNAHFYSILKRHVKSGRLDLRTLTEVEDAHLDAAAVKWTLRVRTRLVDKAHLAVPGAPTSMPDTLADVDHVVCATGSALDLAGVECVRPLLESHPVELVRGLPRLTSDLQWREDVPFFVAGAYAMLELGPDALNLSGTRPGAERIAHRLGALGIFDDVPGGGVHAVPTATAMASRARKEHRSGGEGNFFDGLEVEELSGA